MGQKKEEAFDWDVFRIGGKRAARLGYVTAPDSPRAIAQAMKEFRVPIGDVKRIIVQRTDAYVLAAAELHAADLDPRHTRRSRGKDGGDRHGRR